MAVELCKDRNTLDLTSMRNLMCVAMYTRSSIVDCTAHRVWNVKRPSFLLGVGAFKPRFYGNGVSPCQNVHTIRHVTT